MAETCRLLWRWLCAARLCNMWRSNPSTTVCGTSHVRPQADVVVVVCGMDGALPSVVAGLVDAPVVSDLG